MNNDMLQRIQLLAQSPAFGVAMTLAAWSVAERIQKRFFWAQPLLISGFMIIFLLWIAKIPLESYQGGASFITFWLGTATVALAIPLYKYATLIREALMPVLAGILVGAITGIVSSALIVWALGGNHDLFVFALGSDHGPFSWTLHGDRELIASMMPKSTTTPIAVALAQRLGGVPELTTIFTVVTGMLGIFFGVPFMKFCRIHDHAAVGTAMGSACHAAGTAHLMSEHEIRGSFSGLAIGLCGVTTSLLMMPIRMH